MPDCFGNLPKLEKLDLRDNVLSSLPNSFAQLKNLQSLDLKANDLAQLPDGFQGLSSLKELNLSLNSKLNFETERSKFIQMKQLEFLDLSYNNLSKEQITKLREAMPNCNVINWDYNNNALPQTR